MLRAQATKFEQDFPFGGVHQLLDTVVSQASEAEGERWFGGAAALAHSVLTEAVTPPGEGADLFPLLHGLYWLVNAIVHDRPAIVVVDDAQWADAPSLAALSFLGRRTDDLPLAMVVATRPSPRPELTALVDDPDTIRLEPRPLTEQAMREWLDAELSDTPDATFVTACTGTTGGNPFYLHEVIRDLAREHVAPTGSAVDTLLNATPATVAAATGHRLAKLDAGTRRVAAALAVAESDATPPGWPG